MQEKIFIIGLPRTATTSVCLAMLNLGFKTAHTAYTQEAMTEAQVIADTPVFCDYRQLDAAYPGARFIYLTREPDLWLPSIRQLLKRMYVNLQRDDGGFNPTLKRCYNQIFYPLSRENLERDDFLLGCYQRHQQDIFDYFRGREQDLLTLDVGQADSFSRLLSFLDMTPGKDESGFERINTGAKVTAWNKIRHPLKVEATQSGKIDKVA
ncbi:sulfotransferase family protein [Thalassomonas viridans]|uniref:Sulfotransferase family protein n=1 Tax=Thalassomonas viridans TaxID=137584 RepID=A0AAE9Z4T5_9GAMM|nr:sulfotransferase [Thalassomonas viridans]WDE06771.1 sulfotransferase family protein [Thalassomonas viridans]